MFFYIIARKSELNRLFKGLYINAKVYLRIQERAKDIKKTNAYFILFKLKLPCYVKNHVEDANFHLFAK